MAKRRLIIIERSREFDEQELRMLRLRSAGYSRLEIARALGVEKFTVRDRCKKIKADDMAVHDPRATPEDYERAYP